jgi:hypothetical protein
MIVPLQEMPDAIIEQNQTGRPGSLGAKFPCGNSSGACGSVPAPTSPSEYRPIDQPFLLGFPRNGDFMTLFPLAADVVGVVIWTEEPAPAFALDREFR